MHETYTKRFTVKNIGNCFTEWKIPAVPPNYTVFPMNGTIGIDENIVLDVMCINLSSKTE